jgi:alcohol dehydrogenase
VIETIRSPRQILLGEGTASTIPGLCAAHGRDVLVLTDRVLLSQPGVSALIEAVRGRCHSLTVHADATPDVPLTDVDSAVAAAARCEADVVLAIGGGTVIDLAKMVGVIRCHGGSAQDYYGECRVPGPTMPLLAVPTTSGTGSEVSPVAVLCDPGRELKIGVSSAYLVPDVAVVDPELTLSCPPWVTAHSGVDALCHAVESFISPARPRSPADLTGLVFLGGNAVTGDTAVRAVQAIGPNLVRAVRDGSDRAAREQMSIGALLAGLAFSHAGTGCPHALQYPIGAATGTPHGLGVGLLLPYALASVCDRVAGRLAVLAECVGIQASPDAPAEAATAFIDWVADLLERVEIPGRLADIGVARADLPRLARSAATVTRLLRNHPGPTDTEHLTAILDAAWLGDRDRLTHSEEER